MGRPSKWPPEYRARAVALVRESGRPVTHVAQELGVGSESLRQWVRQEEADRGERADRPTSVESEELRRLRKENSELKRTPGRSWPGGHQPKPSTSSYGRPTRPVLQRPVEPRQYTALRFSQRLADAGVAASMGSTGDSYDNAMAESFFGTIKAELLYRQHWATRHDADMTIFDWIEAWYNPRRIQAALGMRSPDEYEAHFTNPDTPVEVGTQ